MMTMPGLSVKLIEKKWISSAQDRIMSAVDEFCLSPPRVISPRFCRSAMSSAVTMTGPSGALLSNALQRPSSYDQPFRSVLDRGAFTYYFVYPRNRLRNPAFRRFKDWLIAQAKVEPEVASPQGHGKVRDTAMCDGVSRTAPR